MRDIYLWKENGGVICHADLRAAADLDGLTRKPDKTVTEAEWHAAGGIARIVNNKIVLGKTDEEIERENLLIEERELLKELAGKDYKVVKAAERGEILAAVDPELHARRERCRDRINEIREILQ